MRLTVAAWAHWALQSSRTLAAHGHRCVLFVFISNSLPICPSHLLWNPVWGEHLVITRLVSLCIKDREIFIYRETWKYPDGSGEHNHVKVNRSGTC